MKIQTLRLSFLRKQEPSESVETKQFFSNIGFFFSTFSWVPAFAGMTTGGRARANITSNDVLFVKLGISKG